MVELTLTQQFDYRVIADSAPRLSDDDLLIQLKNAHKLLRQKTYILDNILQTQTLDINFMETSDPSYLFNEHLTYLEFEKYKREQRIEVLLGIIKTMMYTDNHIKSLFIS